MRITADKFNADISDYDWCQFFFYKNLPEGSWGERNKKSAEFKNMEVANIK